jgi:hypothetical protein
MFYDRTLVNEANDSHFAGELGADKRICFVDLSEEVGQHLFNSLFLFPLKTLL